MKKITAIIALLIVAAMFVFAGCQKQEAAKPAEQSMATMTATMSGMTSTQTTTAMPAPVKK